MPKLAKNVLINGKVVLAGKSLSAANVKKLGLGDHLFDQVEKPAEEKPAEDTPEE